jgi:hypothetical protein
LAEEMRRVEEFWRWDSRRWGRRAEAYGPDTLATADFGPSPEDLVHPELIQKAAKLASLMRAGKAAYAWRQVSTRQSLAARTREKTKKWFELLEGETKGASVFVEASDRAAERLAKKTGSRALAGGSGSTTATGRKMRAGGRP